MVELTNNIILSEILLESDMLGTIIAAYLFLIPFIVVTFLNIYSVDKYEYLSYKQYRIKFRRKMFFIFMYSKNKHLVSRKTFVLEIISYLLSLASVVICLCSFNLDIDIAIILLGIVYLVVLTFACVTGAMYHKIRKYLI